MNLIIYLEEAEMLSVYITVAVVGGLLILGIGYLLLNKFILSKKRCRKTLKELQAKYEYLHALLTGQDNSYIQRLEMISRTNLLYSDIHASYFRRSKEIRETTDIDLQDLLTDLQALIDENKVKEFKTCLKNKVGLIKQYEESVNQLSLDLANVIKPEEDARQAALVLKEKYREIKSKFNLNETQLVFVTNSFNMVFDEIDRKFNKFELYVEDAKYEEANALLPKIDQVLDLLNKLIDTLPPVIVEVNDVIPQRLIELKNKFIELTNTKKPLTHLNVDQKIESLNLTLDGIKENLKNLAVSNIEEKIKDVNKQIDDLFNAFKSEEDACVQYNDISGTVLSEFAEYEKEIIKIRNNIAKFRKVYIIDEDHESQLEKISKRLDEVGRDKRKLDILVHNRENTPYTELLEKLNALKSGTEDIKSKVNSFNIYLNSLRNDSQQAFENLKIKYDLFKSLEAQLREIRIDKYVDLYKPAFDELYEILDELNRLLKTVPIDVTAVNLKSTELNEKNNKINQDIKNIINYKELAEGNILLVNRDRMKFSEINNILSQAETLFFNGDFKSSYEMSQTAIQKLDFKDKN